MIPPPALTPPDASDPGGPGLPSPAPAARERMVETLTQLFAQDQITEADLERRLDRVYRATTPGELESVIADLPALVPQGGTTGNPSEPVQRIGALLSGQERVVTGVVPRELELKARLGYVELDLTRATFAPGLTWIDVRAFMGYVQIRLPPGVRVESDGRAFAGFFSLKGVPQEGAGGASRVVRVTGRATFGFVECHLPSAGDDPPPVPPAFPENRGV
jgi:hypothetical protein